MLACAPSAQADVVTDANAKAADIASYDGVHYHNSAQVGTATGKKIGELAARSIPRATR